jgi:hypothetical protein
MCKQPDMRRCDNNNYVIHTASYFVRFKSYIHYIVSTSSCILSYTENPPNPALVDSIARIPSSNKGTSGMDVTFKEPRSQVSATVGLGNIRHGEVSLGLDSAEKLVY